MTGALIADCYHDDIPVAVLIVRSNPYIPDPGAAHAAIEDSLEPLVAFDINTQELEEQAAEIRERKQQIADQLQQSRQQQEQQQPQAPSTYQ